MVKILVRVSYWSSISAMLTLEGPTTEETKVKDSPIFFDAYGEVRFSGENKFIRFDYGKDRVLLFRLDVYESDHFKILDDSGDICIGDLGNLKDMMNIFGAKTMVTVDFGAKIRASTPGERSGWEIENVMARFVESRKGRCRRSDADQPVDPEFVPSESTEDLMFAEKNNVLNGLGERNGLICFEGGITDHSTTVIAVRAEEFTGYLKIIKKMSGIFYPIEVNNGLLKIKTKNASDTARYWERVESDIRGPDFRFTYAIGLGQIIKNLKGMIEIHGGGGQGLLYINKESTGFFDFTGFIAPQILGDEIRGVIGDAGEIEEVINLKIETTDIIIPEPLDPSILGSNTDEEISDAVMSGITAEKNEQYGMALGFYENISDKIQSDTSLYGIIRDRADFLSELPTEILFPKA